MLVVGGSRITVATGDRPNLCRQAEQAPILPLPQTDALSQRYRYQRS